MFSDFGGCLSTCQYVRLFGCARYPRFACDMVPSVRQAFERPWLSRKCAANTAFALPPPPLPRTLGWLGKEGHWALVGCVDMRLPSAAFRGFESGLRLSERHSFFSPRM